MSKPGITNKSGWSWKKKAAIGAGGVVALAGALALSQCGGDQTPAPTNTSESTDTPPPANTNGWKDDAWVYQYTAGENMPVRESASADGKPLKFLKEDSCVEALPGTDGYAARDNGFAQVSVKSADGTVSTGWMELKKLSNDGSYKIGGKVPPKTCTAEFITSAAGEEQKSVPVQLLSVSGGANFYRTPDETSAIAGFAGDASCIKTTGNQRGNMIEVQINDDQKPYWAVAANFRPAPLHVTAQTCNAKFEPSL